MKKTPERILVAIEPAMRANAAALRAVELARKTGARLHLFMPVYDAHIAAAADFAEPEVERLAREHYLDARRRWLSDWTRDLAAQRLDVCYEVLWARMPDEAVLARTLDLDPDLVVQELSRESVFGHWSAVRSSVWRLARSCPAPLMLVRPDAPLLPGRVAAAVAVERGESDGGHELDDLVLHHAVRMAMTVGAELDLVHVFPYDRKTEGMSVRIDAIVERQRREDHRLFGEFADRHGVDLPQRLLLGGNPAQELLRHVQQSRTELLVIGHAYRSGLERLWLGSTAESLIAQTPCDVLLLRPPEFRAELTRHYDLHEIRTRYGLSHAA